MHGRLATVRFDVLAPTATKANFGSGGFEDTSSVTPTVPDDLLIHVKTRREHTRVDEEVAPQLVAQTGRHLQF